MTPLLRVVESGDWPRAVYAGRCRVGYLFARNDGEYVWELHLISEAERGHPRGLGSTQEAALRQMSYRFSAWCCAAGLERRRTE